MKVSKEALLEMFVVMGYSRASAWDSEKLEDSIRNYLFGEGLEGLEIEDDEEQNSLLQSIISAHNDGEVLEVIDAGKSEMQIAGAVLEDGEIFDNDDSEVFDDLVEDDLVEDDLNGDDLNGDDLGDEDDKFFDSMKTSSEDMKAEDEEGMASQEVLGRDELESIPEPKEAEVVKKKKRKAPTKECPNCKVRLHARKVLCECGYSFKTDLVETPKEVETIPVKVVPFLEGKESESISGPPENDKAQSDFTKQKSQKVKKPAKGGSSTGSFKANLSRERKSVQTMLDAVEVLLSGRNGEFKAQLLDRKKKLQADLKAIEDLT